MLAAVLPATFFAAFVAIFFVTTAAGSLERALIKVLEDAPEVADDCSERLKREELVNNFPGHSPM